MKKQILLLAFLFSLFVSCVKEDDPEKKDVNDTIKGEVPVVVKNSQRITKASNISFGGLITSQTRYTYDGENLSKVSYYRYTNGELLEWDRSEFTYSLNEITRLDTRKVDNFQQAHTKYVYKFVDGKRTESIGYSYVGGSFDYNQKVAYTYLNGKLVSYSARAKMETYIISEYERANYIYENDKVKAITVLGNISNVWEDKRKTECFYENGKLVKRIQTELESGSWNVKVTWEYFYNGDDITTITYKHSDATEPVIYKYENNYLVEIFFGIDTMIYEYEAGHGNASVVIGGPTAPLFVGQTIR